MGCKLKEYKNYIKSDVDENLSSKARNIGPRFEGTLRVSVVRSWYPEVRSVFDAHFTLYEDVDRSAG